MDAPHERRPPVELERTAEGEWRAEDPVLAGVCRAEAVGVPDGSRTERAADDREAVVAEVDEREEPAKAGDAHGHGSRRALEHGPRSRLRVPAHVAADDADERATPSEPRAEERDRVGEE